MTAFTLTLDQAIMFYEICQETGAKTEEQRCRILVELARYGQVERVVQSPKTKEEYVKHLAQNFSVLKITGEQNGNS